MTDAERVMILLTAIRCILSLDDQKDVLRLKLIKSVLFEAVQQCARGHFGNDWNAGNPICTLIRAIEEEVAMREVV
jgi:hypothetical protein